MKILVVCGGDSKEKDVSINTGKAVFEALKANFDNIECLICKDKKSCILSILNSKPDKVFLALHGGWGENGEIQAALDLLNIDYTGSGFEASCLAMNKFATKSILSNIKIPTAKACLIKDVSDVENVDFYPVCIKPNSEGSSVGVEFADTKEEAKQKIQLLLKDYKELIAEERLDGKELTVTVFNDTVFPIIEIKPKKGFYDYKNKYTKGATEYIVPAQIDKSVEMLCKSVAFKAYKSIGCRGCARVDMILKNNIPYVLEINTIPGMTGTSLAPKSANAAGIEFQELTKMMIEG